MYVWKNLIWIENGYEINRKRDMRTLLERTKTIYPECAVFNRSYFSLMCEWKAHNRLYKLGMWKSHTKDVDLEYPQKWYYKIIYFILGI